MWEDPESKIREILGHLQDSCDCAFGGWGLVIQDSTVRMIDAYLSSLSNGHHHREVDAVPYQR
jgi:hypothetical protein